MIRLVIAEDEQAQLLKMAREIKDADVRGNVLMILALADGQTCKQIGRMFRVDKVTVWRLRKRFLARKLFSDWLAKNHKGSTGKLTDEEEAELTQFVKDDFVTDVLQVVVFIKERFDKEYSVSGATKLLHRLGFVYKEVTLVPGKLNEEAQEEFVEKYEDLRDNLPVNQMIMFIDACHPSHNVHATKAWVMKGEQKQVKTNTGRKRVNINGALDVENMQAITHTSATVNAQSTMELFDKIQAANPDKETIWAISDNARYYKCKLLDEYLARADCRVKMIHLPTYSPNLNLIERLWRFMHKYIIGVKRRETFAEFEADVLSFFTNFAEFETALRSSIGTKMHLIKVA